MSPPLLSVRLSCETCDRTIDARAGHVAITGSQVLPLKVEFPPNPDGSPSAWKWEDGSGATCPECGKEKG